MLRDNVLIRLGRDVFGGLLLISICRAGASGIKTYSFRVCKVRGGSLAR